MKVTTHLQQAIFDFKVEQIVVLESGRDALRQTLFEVVKDIGETAEDGLSGEGERIAGLLNGMKHCQNLGMAKTIQLADAESQYFRDGLLSFGLVQFVRCPFIEEKNGNFLNLIRVN